MITELEGRNFTHNLQIQHQHAVHQMPLINIDNLKVTRNNTTICSVTKLSIEPGERIGVLGTNGSGKTTLLRVLAGLETTYNGNCNITVTRDQRVYVDQRGFLSRGTVLANATYGLRARGVHRRIARHRAIEFLEAFAIRDLADTSVDRLSSGERRRTALARAIAIRPQVLLLDEPLAEMDLSGADCLGRILDELTGTTILFSSPISLPDRFVNRTYRFDDRPRLRNH